MSLYIVINFLFYLLTYKFSNFFFNNVVLVTKKRKKAPSIASITLFKYCWLILSDMKPD